MWLPVCGVSVLVNCLYHSNCLWIEMLPVNTCLWCALSQRIKSNLDQKKREAEARMVSLMCECIPAVCTFQSSSLSTCGHVWPIVLQAAAKEEVARKSREASVDTPATVTVRFCGPRKSVCARPQRLKLFVLPRIPPPRAVQYLCRVLLAASY